MNKTTLFTLSAVLSLLPIVTSAVTVCNNCTLSASSSSPTAFSFTPGDNIVTSFLQPSITSLTTATADSRFFSFNVPVGQQLNSITLDSYTSFQLANVGTATGSAFFGIKQGAPITPSLSDPNSIHGGTLLATTSFNANGLQSTVVGGDLFPNLIASAGVTGVTLSSPLLAGDYYVWLRESRTIDSFSLNFKVSAVPLPASVWLLGSAMLGMLGLRQRRI